MHNKVLGHRVWERAEDGSWKELWDAKTVSLAQAEEYGEVWIYHSRAPGIERKVLVGSLDCFTFLELDAIYADSPQLCPLPPISHNPPVRMLVIGSSASTGYSLSFDPSSHKDREHRMGSWESYPFVAQNCLNRDLPPEEDGKFLISQVIGYAEKPLCTRQEKGMGELFWGVSPWDDERWDFETQKGYPLNNISNLGPTAILVVLGTSDLEQSIPLAQFEQSLSTLLRQLIIYFSETLRDIIIVPPLPTHVNAPHWTQALAGFTLPTIPAGTTIPRLHYWNIWRTLQRDAHFDTTSVLNKSGQERAGQELARLIREEGWPI
ncbi:hypothetical protein BT69DRAFT_1282002 [Atractiella rhizophila]|nr:hypothetical protein BT69DRAFT_1282002 [Atractiella rhizophila]